MADNISPTDNANDLSDNTTVSDASTAPTTGVATPPNDSIQSGPDAPNTPSNVSQPAMTPDNTGLTSASVEATPRQPAPKFTQFPAQSADQTPDYSNHPAVQRADLLHTIAQTLAGGPRFQTTIDPDTGHVVHKAVPLSKADIGMALAAEAIQGSLAGLSVANGPGNLGRAAGAGGAATMRARQQVDQQQDNQANADFARHAQVFETNMRLHQNALAVGRQNFDANQKYVGQFAPLVDQLIKDHPEVIKGIVNESDLTKYHVTKDSAMPYKTVPRIDPSTGEQAHNSYGEPQWDTQYAIIDPNYKSGDLLDDNDKALAAKLRLPGFADSDGKPSDLPQSLPMRLSMATNIKAKLAAFGIAQGSLGDFFDTLNKHDSGASRSVFDMFPSTEALADFITKQEGSKPTDRNARNNNPGNLIADASWTGNVDKDKLAPEQNGIGYRVYDSPEEGRAALIHQLELDKSRTPNASPEQFFRKYDATNPAAYAAAARQAAGVKAPVESPSPYSAPDLQAAVQKDPTLLNTLDKFNPMLEAAGGNYEKAIGALGKTDPTSAGKMLQLLGGTKAVRQYDQKQTADLKATQTAQKNKEAVDQARAMIPVKAEQTAADETARLTAKNAVDAKKLHDQINQAAGETPDQTGVRPNFLGSLTIDEQDLLKGIATGKTRLGSMGLSRTQQIDLQSKVSAAYPEVSQATLNNYYKAGEDVNTGRKNLDAANVAFEHLGEYFDAAGRAGYFGTTPGLSALTKNFGPAEKAQAVTDYQQARDRAGQEIEAAYKGAGLTDKDAAHQKDLFTAATPDAAKRIAVAASNLLTAKFSAVDSRLAGVMPSSETPIQDLMSSKAHAGYRLIHDGKDFDAAGAQRENQTKYGAWYGRGALQKLQTRDGGQSGNGQANQPATQYPFTTKDGKQGWDGSKWVQIQPQGATTQNPQ